MAKEDFDKKMSELEKNFGLQKASNIKEYETIKTGIYAFDYVLDGGIKIVNGGHKLELYGRESSGKTTMALKIVAKFQELGKICVWVVSESFHEKWARDNGVNTDKLLIYYPESVEDAGEKILELTSQVDLVVVDSVASLIPEAELERSLSEKTRGAQAKAYSEFTRKFYKKMAHQKMVFVIINQMREKMGIVYGNPETTPCGRALRHLMDSRVEFRAGKSIEEGTKEKKEIIGIETGLFGYKNKLGTAKRRQIMDFYLNGRIDNKKSLLFAGIKYNVIEFSGKTYTFEDKKIVGKDNFIKILVDKDWKKIEEEVWKRAR